MTGAAPVTPLAAAARLLPPETAHRLAVRGLGAGLVRAAPPAPPRLRTTALGLNLSHPIGVAAGFDKDAEAYPGLLKAGFAFVEVGTLTPRPQPGNPKPRVFRLPRDRAVINRLGFNNGGLDGARARLARRDRAAGVVGGNIGINKGAPDPAADYAAGMRALYPVVDYLTVNVSSPNTPGLRALQDAAPLRRLLERLTAERAGLSAGGRPKPLLVKIAPDLSPDDEAAIAETALAAGIDGLIVANTTVARPASLRGRRRGETGGLSGRPLFDASTELLRRMFRLTGGRLALVGVGGVATGADAYAKIRAGASLVQLYTAMVYEGPGIARGIVAGLDARLAADGLAGVAEAVGADAGKDRP